MGHTVIDNPYQVVEYLPEKVRQQMKEHMNFQVQEKLKDLDEDTVAFGVLVYNDVDVLKGKYRNVYLEFFGRRSDIIVVRGLSMAVLFDDMPDFLLDRYNELKKVGEKKSEKI